MAMASSRRPQFEGALLRQHVWAPWEVARAVQVVVGEMVQWVPRMVLTAIVAAQCQYAAEGASSKSKRQPGSTAPESEGRTRPVAPARPAHNGQRRSRVRGGRRGGAGTFVASTAVFLVGAWWWEGLWQRGKLGHVLPGGSHRAAWVGAPATRWESNAPGQDPGEKSAQDEAYVSERGLGRLQRGLAEEARTMAEQCGLTEDHEGGIEVVLELGRGWHGGQRRRRQRARRRGRGPQPAHGAQDRGNSWGAVTASTRGRREERRRGRDYK